MNSHGGGFWITETPEQRHWREVSTTRQRIGDLERQLAAEKARLAELTKIAVVRKD
jgi:hypothetical protein